MVSPELLRRYSFFGVFDDSQLKAIAMIAEEQAYAAGETIFEDGRTAEAFYLLVDGSVDLFVSAKDETGSEFRKPLPVGEVNPGEPFGFSALVDPFVFTTLARASKDSRVIEFDGLALRSLSEQNQALAYQFMRQTAKAALERLYSTRVQLAAAWA
jgi:CRP-like cAMP-binding protein